MELALHNDRVPFAPLARRRCRRRMKGFRASDHRGLYVQSRTTDDGSTSPEAPAVVDGVDADRAGSAVDHADGDLAAAFVAEDLERVGDEAVLEVLLFHAQLVLADRRHLR